MTFFIFSIRHIIILVGLFDEREYNKKPANNKKSTTIICKKVKTMYFGTQHIILLLSCVLVSVSSFWESPTVEAKLPTPPPVSVTEGKTAEGTAPKASSEAAAAGGTVVVDVKSASPVPDASSEAAVEGRGEVPVEEEEEEEEEEDIEEEEEEDIEEEEEEDIEEEKEEEEEEEEEEE